MESIDIILIRHVAAVLNKYLAYRRQSPVLTWESNFSQGNEKFIHCMPGGIQIELHKDSELSRLIHASFEDKEQHFIDRIIQPGDVFLDIGANIGLHSLLACRAMNGSGEVYAFEPTPKTYGRLNANVSLNGWENQIQTFNIGLSDRPDELLLNVSEHGHDAWNSFADLQHVTFDHQTRVAVQPLGDFVSDKHIAPDRIALIKIDVEGWELKVLAGCETLFADPDFAPCFLIEFTEENMFRAGYSCRDIYNLMVEKGYEWFEYRLADHRLLPSPLKAYYPYENLIAVKTGRLSAVQDRLDKNK